jgi:hypothetical protein
MDAADRPERDHGGMLLATACVGQNITRHLGQTEYVVEFAISQQPSIGGHQGAARIKRRSKSSRTASDPDSPLGCAMAASLDPG